MSRGKKGDKNMFGDLFECYCPRQIKQTVIALTCSLSFHALTYNCESTNSPFGTNSLLRCCCCKPAAHCSKSRDHVDPDAPSQSQLTVSNVTAVIKLMVNLYMLRTLCWRMPGGDSAVDNNCCLIAEHTTPTDRRTPFAWRRAPTSAGANEISGARRREL